MKLKLILLLSLTALTARAQTLSDYQTDIRYVLNGGTNTVTKAATNVVANTNTINAEFVAPRDYSMGVYASVLCTSNNLTEGLLTFVVQQAVHTNWVNFTTVNLTATGSVTVPVTLFTNIQTDSRAKFRISDVRWVDTNGPPTNITFIVQQKRAF